MTIRPYQQDIVDAVIEYLLTKQGNPLVASPTGTGKCFGRGTSILMFDGTHKNVENVVVGDILMGPDSLPRRVESLATGEEMLYRVTPVKGETYVVNESHILSLKLTGGSKGYGEKDKLVNVDVKSYLEFSKSKKHVLKGWKPEIIHYPAKHLEVPPYILGLWLGDGHSYHPAITAVEHEILEEWKAYGNSLPRCKVRTEMQRGIPTVHIARTSGWRNPLLKFLKDKRLLMDKHIPTEYLTADESQRLELLAGLIDTDGYMTSGGFDFISKFWRLASNLCQLCHSLGLAAHVKTALKSSQHGTEGVYYRVTISGDCSRVPVRLVRKKAPPRTQIKNVCRTGISLKPLGVGEYFGFTISGPDRLFLLSDFTVVHNTVAFNALIKELVTRWPGIRIMCIAHVKEIIGQNASSMVRYWPEAPVGIYSAGLKQYDTHHDIIFSSIQSIHRRPHEFGEIHVVLIDEAHMVSPAENSMYSKLIKAMKEVSPTLRVVGFSATPYRLGQGMLVEGELFDEVCIDLTTTDRFNQFVTEGHLCKLVTKDPNHKVDVTNVSMKGGEFDGEQVAALFNTDDMNAAVVDECIKYGAERKHWLGFAASVAHAENLVRECISRGISAISVDGKLDGEERDRRFKAFESGEYRCLVNVGIATTGYDFPALDMIFVARATQSTGLWIQCLGRGTRTSNGKTSCLVLDFASNCARLGPINAPVIPKPRKKGEGGGDAPVKTCPQCGSYCHTKVSICPDCEYEFPPSSCLERTASSMQVMIDADETPIFETRDVYSVLYRSHTSKVGTPCVRVCYMLGMSDVSEWITFKDGAYFEMKIKQWWQHRRGRMPAPKTVDEFLSRTTELTTPESVTMIVNKKYPDITGATMPGEVEAPF